MSDMKSLDALRIFRETEDLTILDAGENFELHHVQHEPDFKHGIFYLEMGEAIKIAEWILAQVNGVKGDRT